MSEYPNDWPEIALAVKRDAEWRCVRCGHYHDPASGHTLTVHHLDGDKANCERWNLPALCQRCHLQIQAKVDMRQGFLFPERHSDWFKPYVQGWEEAYCQRPESDASDDITILQGDAAELPLEDDAVDLIVTSPPYENARTYGIDFTDSGEEWVAWAVPRFRECLRVCKGLVAWVVQGVTRRYRWSAVPALLIADLHRQGVCFRRPVIYRRSGIPGSGGPDWWRCDHEYVICATRKPGRLSWSLNTASGEPCKYDTGGEMSNRHQDGQRRNAKTGARLGRYRGVEIANPGDVIHCKVGKGHMGSDLAHETEAPFPESLVEPFVRCFCPPGGIVLDPMCGSGTTLAVARKHGRRAIGYDIRPSQVALAKRRLDSYAPLFGQTRIST